MFTLVFFLMLTAHFWGDYTLQTEFVTKYKVPNKTFPLVLHVILSRYNSWLFGHVNDLYSNAKHDVRPMAWCSRNLSTSNYRCKQDIQTYRHSYRYDSTPKLQAYLDSSSSKTNGYNIMLKYDVLTTMVNGLNELLEKDREKYSSIVGDEYSTLGVLNTIIRDTKYVIVGVFDTKTKIVDRFELCLFEDYKERCKYATELKI